MTASHCNGHSPAFPPDQLPCTAVHPASQCERFYAPYKEHRMAPGLLEQTTIDRLRREPYHRATAPQRLSRDSQYVGPIRERTFRARVILLHSVCCIVTIAVSVTLSYLLLRNIPYQGTGVGSASGGGQDQRMCVPCSPKQEQIQKAGSDPSQATYFCCSADDTQMQQLIVEGVRRSLQDRLKGEELYTLLNNPLLPPPINRNAAHVFFRPNRRSAPYRRKVDADQSLNDNFETLLHWSSDGDSAFIRHGIEFNSSSGHFRVKVTGIYVIYSRIVYENAAALPHEPPTAAAAAAGNDPDPDRPPRFIFGHSISLYAGSSHYKPLLEDEQVMSCDVNTVCYNSQIFSTLHLTKDSQVAVRAMQSRFVSSRSHASFFGVYKID